MRQFTVVAVYTRPFIVTAVDKGDAYNRARALIEGDPATVTRGGGHVIAAGDIDVQYRVVDHQSAESR